MSTRYEPSLEKLGPSQQFGAAPPPGQYVNVTCGEQLYGWAVTFGIASRGLSGTRCTKCDYPRMSGQCTNFMLFDVAL